MADRDEGGGRRYLIATAVTRYPKAPELDRPELVAARAQIVDLFTGTLGYRQVTDIGLDPSRDQLTDLVNRFCRSSERRPDDLVVVYVAGHGEVLDDAGFDHVLLMSDTDPDNPVSALRSVDLARAMLLKTKVRRVMLLLDTCYSGRGGQDVIAASVSKFAQRWGSVEGAGFVVVASAQPHEQAYAESFPTLLREAVEALPVAGHGPDVLDIGAVVERMNRNPLRPPDQRIGWNTIGLSGTVPAFLPNPRHDEQVTGADRYSQQSAEWEARDEQREIEYRKRFLTKAMAHHGVDGKWWFVGRHKAFAAITAWSTALSAERPALVVFGGPGSGKTAVLGLVATLAHPERRQMVPINTLRLDQATIPPVGMVDLEIYAGGLTTDEVLSRMAAAAETVADTPGQLVSALAKRGRRWTVLVDALDEASDPKHLIARLLRPLLVGGGGTIRLLLGVRTHLVHLIPADLREDIDLDGDYADPSAVRAHIVRSLLGASPESPYPAVDHKLCGKVADQVAVASGTSFLIAHLTSHTLAANPDIPNPNDVRWRAGLPRIVGVAVAQDLDRLGEHAQRARDLLLPLAYAQGQGLPWEDVWARLASRISGRHYTDEDLLWLRRSAGSYVVETAEGNRSAYRLYHRAMAEHLSAGQDDARVHRTFVEVLTSCTPRTETDAIDWAHAHPYSQRNLATHAAEADVLDELLADGDYLVHAMPDTLLPALHKARGSEGRLTATVYRMSAHLHRGADPVRRRQLLALDAARLRARTQLAAMRSGLAWRPRWSTSSQAAPALYGSLADSSRVYTVGCTTLDGSPVVITGGDGVDLWDLPTGQKIMRLDDGRGTTAVACTVLDNCPVAVTTSAYGGADVWDLRSGRHLRRLEGHQGRVWSVACTRIDGRPIAVTGGTDRTVRVWELATGQCLATLEGHTRTVRSVACTASGNRVIAVSVGWDGAGLVWDLFLDHGSPAVAVLAGHLGRVTAVACALVEGKPVAVTGSRDRTVRVWDLAEDAGSDRLRFTLTGHSHRVWAVACTRIDGRPVAVTGGTDCSVRVWDLRTGSALGELTGHTDRVTAVACVEIDGQPVAVTANTDRTTRVWDLSTVDTGVSAGSLWAVASTVIDGRPIAVTGGTDNTVQLWDITTGRHNATLTGHTDKVTAVATIEFDGRPIAVSGGGDRTVRVWDLRSHQHTTLTGHTDRVWTVATMVLDGRPVAISGSGDRTLRVWDLRTGRCTRTMTGHRAAVWAVTSAVLDGRAVAVTAGDDRRIVVWDLHSGEILRDFAGAPTRVWSLACADVGHPAVVTAHQDGSARVWNLSTGALDAELNGKDAMHAVDCAVVAGRSVAITAGADKTVRVWDLLTGRCTTMLEGHVDTVWATACAEVDGRPIAVSGGDDRSLRVWDLLSGPTGAHIGQVTALACAVVDGRPIAVSGSADQTARLWDLTSGHTISTFPLLSAVKAIAPTTVDGEPAVAIGYANRTMTIVNLTRQTTYRRTLGRSVGTGELTAVACTTVDGLPTAVLGGINLVPHLWREGEESARALSQRKHPVTSIACTTIDGRPVAVVGTTGGMLHVWELTSRRPTGGGEWPSSTDTSSVLALDCTVVDGRPIAVTGHASSTVRVWDLTSGTVLGTLAGHTGRVRAAVCLIRNGSPIAVTGGDHTVRIWDLTTMTATAVYVFPDQVHAIAATSDGTIVVGSGHEVAVLEAG